MKIYWRFDISLEVFTSWTLTTRTGFRLSELSPLHLSKLPCKFGKKSINITATPWLLLKLQPLPPSTCHPVSSKQTCFVSFPDLFLLQVSLATFTVYVLLGNELTAGKAFVAISLFNILRFPLTMLPRVVMNFIQVHICSACQRTLLHFTVGKSFLTGR